VTESLIHIDEVHIGTITVVGGQPPALQWHVGPVVQQIGGSMPIEVSISTEEKVRLAVTPLTAGGQPATVDGPAQWSVAGACTVEPIDDTSAWILAGSTMGDSTVTVGCDADLGEGVVPLGDTCLVHVSNPMAANLGLSADAPVMKDTP
jgi:hypothetical protein